VSGMSGVIGVGGVWHEVLSAVDGIPWEFP